MRNVSAIQVAELSIVGISLPGQAVENVGVILRNPETGEYRLRFRRDWQDFAGEEAEVLALLPEDIDSRLREEGVEWLRRWEDSLSNTIRITDRERVTIGNLDRDVERLYQRHVRPAPLAFRTHLPLYSARVAAGKFLDGEMVEEREWIEMPPELHLTPDMFVVRITGRSMEPKIPDGSLCVFRATVAGSRSGRLLLIERLDVDEEAGRYTVKRYRSLKRQEGETWRHQKIRLEPLNREFEAWDLEDDPHRFRVIGELVRVLED